MNRIILPLIASVAVALSASVSGGNSESKQGDAPIPICNRIRFVPRAGHTATMVGGKFQGSNLNATSGFVDLAVIDEIPRDGEWSEVRMTNTTAYGCLRYLAPADSWGNIAELEFYDGHKKIEGTPYGTYGSRNNSGNTFDKAFDGDPNTFFDAPLADGQYVGIVIKTDAQTVDAGTVGSGDLRHYHLGNSLTDTEGEFLQSIAKAAGHTNDFFERNTIPGSPLRIIWENNQGFGTPFREGLKKFAPISDLVGQVYIDNGDDDDPRYSIDFYDYAKQYSPEVRYWVYGQWPGIETSTPSLANPIWWERRMVDYFRTYTMHALNVMKARPARPVKVIPGGLALLNVKKTMEQGKMPGLTNFFETFFEDSGHLSADGRYFIGLVHYAALYDKNPIGLPMVGLGDRKPNFSTEQNRILEQIAWDTVVSFQAAPELVVAKLVPCELDIREHVNGGQPYEGELCKLQIDQGSQYHYLVRPPKPGRYQLVISAANDSDQAKPLQIMINDAPAQVLEIAPTKRRAMFIDSTPLSINLKTGLNRIGLVVPDHRPYQLNSIKILNMDGGGVEHTLPMSKIVIYRPSINLDEEFTTVFSVADAELPEEAVVVTAISENKSLVPGSSIMVERGDFGGGNRRITVRPAPGQSGVARINLTFTAGEVSRYTTFLLYVKHS